MILTEEQRGALARAIDYINETDLPIGELDGFDREVLRAMIDSSDPITDVTELVELLAAGEHEQWVAWAQAILDSEPGLSDGRKAAWPGLIATPYENLSEEMKDEDRRVVHLRSQVVLDYIQQQSAEIERLRPFEIAARDLDSDLTKIAGERDDQAARIKELEDALAEERAKYNLSWKDCAYRAPDTYCEKTHNYCTSEDCPLLDEQKTEARRQLRAEGKIGPDAKPRVWQITEERKAALWHAIKVLKENDIMEEPDEHLWDEEVTVLQAMLTEAGQ